MSVPRKDQIIGVIGPAGFGGSYLCVELIRRGHAVVGLSRNPECFGTCHGYTPRQLDIESASIEDLAKAFTDIDVLVSQYGPHTQGAGAWSSHRVPKEWGHWEYHIEFLSFSNN